MNILQHMPQLLIFSQGYMRKEARYLYKLIFTIVTMNNKDIFYIRKLFIIKCFEFLRLRPNFIRKYFFTSLSEKSLINLFEIDIMFSKVGWTNRKHP